MLPHARHLARVPAHLGEAQVARLRQSGYLLPQVVRPEDIAPGLDHRAAEQRLDELGYIQLQKAAPGGRPARWIDPALMDLALAHLDAVGTGAGARALMLERQGKLESLGLLRLHGHFEREAVQAMAIPVPDQPDWSLSRRFRTAVDHAPIWRFLRDGDLPALRSAIGPTPTDPDADTLRRHLAALVARSEAFQTRRLDALQPRLQAECARPQSTAELMAACTRVQERWEHWVAELDALDGLTSELAFRGYPDSFATARSLQRSVTLYLGPPNSGKTYAAFERLAQAHKGAYLAPLRLLALEGRDRLVGRGVPCSLLTGEENVPAADARVVSSTIEMVDTGKPIDVAVIDEAQMLFDESRGWAWTQAIVGVPANEVIIIASEFAADAIRNLLALCGERCSVRVFERMQHVELLPRPVPVESLVHGDAVVAFSRREVLRLRDRIAADGHEVSVIYGALPPEVRRREAERFAGGAAKILVATDAIGMGLNLPIRRVLFSTLTKFDGESDRQLDTSEVQQIAGRAGRFGLHEEGLAGVLDAAEPTALRQLREAMHRKPHAPRDFKAPVAPNPWHVRTIASRLQLRDLRAVLDVFVAQLRLDDAHFAVAELDQMLELAADLDRHAAGLNLMQRFTYAQAPVDTRTDSQREAFLAWTREHAAAGSVSRPWFLDDVDGYSRLDRLEQALRACTLWLWLDLRFPGIYGQVEEVQALRRELNDGIERQLKGKRPLAMVRQRRR